MCPNCGTAEPSLRPTHRRPRWTSRNGRICRAGGVGRCLWLAGGSIFRCGPWRSDVGEHSRAASRSSHRCVLARRHHSSDPNPVGVDRRRAPATRDRPRWMVPTQLQCWRSAPEQFRTTRNFVGLTGNRSSPLASFASCRGQRRWTRLLMAATIAAVRPTPRPIIMAIRDV
jgi:hypothetical protein